MMNEKDLQIEKDCGLVEFHEKTLNILKIIHSICQKYNISYSTYAGTMIGQVRHQGFIPWDDDADICMTRDDFNRFCEVVEKELPKNMRFVTPYSFNNKFHDMVYRIVNLDVSFSGTSTTENYDILNHSWVDIFILDKRPVSNFKFRRQVFHLKVTYGMLMSKRKIKQIQKHSFKENLQIFVLRTLGYLSSFKSLTKHYVKLSVKYNKTRSNEYFSSNELVNYIRVFYYEDNIKTVDCLPFASTKLCCYRGYDEMLTRMYGTYMTPPEHPEAFMRHFTFNDKSLESIIEEYNK